MIVVHIAREQITISSTAKQLDNDASDTIFTALNKGRIRYADVQILTANVRVTHDGSTAPVAATTGTLWYVSQVKRIWGIDNIIKLKLIRDTSTDAIVVANYWGSQV